jgi:chromosome partitioning protein
MRQKVITIAQQKGGAGKTTIAVHLTVALAQRGFKVAVVDIDPQGSFTQWHKIREERMGEGYTGIHFSSLSGWRVGSEVSRLQRNYDVIIIDSPPHVETEARTAIRAADLVLVPVQPSPTDLWATQATVTLAKGEKIPVRTILNRVSANSKLVEQIRTQLPELATSTLGNRVAFASSLLEGKGVTEVDPKSLASQEMKALVQEILSLFPKEAGDTEEEAVEEKTTGTRAKRR